MLNLSACREKNGTDSWAYHGADPRECRSADTNHGCRSSAYALYGR